MMPYEFLFLLFVNNWSFYFKINDQLKREECIVQTIIKLSGKKLNAIAYSLFHLFFGLKMARLWIVWVNIESLQSYVVIH